MPTVFLSYSSEDLPLIEQLEAQLKKHSEISIWRDQEKIYGGQKWPKVLGEAIADQDVVLLAWSKHAAASTSSSSSGARPSRKRRRSFPVSWIALQCRSHLLQHKGSSRPVFQAVWLPFTGLGVLAYPFASKWYWRKPNQ